MWPNDRVRGSRTSMGTPGPDRQPQAVLQIWIHRPAVPGVDWWRPPNRRSSDGLQLLLRRLGHQVVAALLGQLARPRVVGDELAIALMDLAGDDDRVDVRDIGREDHRGDRVDDRRGTGGAASDPDQLRLLA